MTADIAKAIELLQEVQRIQEIQRDRGWNSIRYEMIEKMLFDVQQEVVHALRENATKELA